MAVLTYKGIVMALFALTFIALGVILDHTLVLLCGIGLGLIELALVAIADYEARKPPKQGFTAYKLIKECPKCRGLGFDPQIGGLCQKCAGRGYLW
jgi:hypothetical protein